MHEMQIVDGMISDACVGSRLGLP